MDQFFNLYSQFQNFLFQAERIPDVILALLLSVVFGFLLKAPVRPAIYSLFDVLFTGVGRRLDKGGRPRGDLVFRGFLSAFVFLQLAYLIGAGLYFAVRYFAGFDILQGVILAFLMTTGALWASVFRLYNVLRDKKSSKGAYLSVVETMRIDLSKADDHAVTRCALESLLRVFDKNVIGVSFWFLIGGLPLAFIYSAVTHLSFRYGRYGLDGGYGAVFNMVEKLMGFIPSFLSALFIALASIISPGASIVRSFGALFSPVGAMPYLQGGLPLHVLAHGFNVALGGPVKDLDGYALKRNWCGPKKASAKVLPENLRAALFMCAAAHLLFLSALLGAYIIGVN